MGNDCFKILRHTDTSKLKENFAKPLWTIKIKITELTIPVNTTSQIKAKRPYPSLSAKIPKADVAIETILVMRAMTSIRSKAFRMAIAVSVTELNNKDAPAKRINILVMEEYPRTCERITIVIQQIKESTIIIKMELDRITLTFDLS